ncbi:hypothetical protein Ccar_14030 [Clostridium carboxidivorans P7]|uniref:Uncharacterized protein n=1 Tax=Clostridium carboxidivorans P7 TaxID=536227 RepID=C6PS33_9CLOT|nr:hypothetical protein [Clostridium carboxidivorans]AKN31918.1 hypothetical protein Ccar_14030 [Clostridium carboxidivorans P7]EET87958.1 hypothetical protein CcarbDRAFT_1600 [Clostridium carboxidivorans P7]
MKWFCFNRNKNKVEDNIIINNIKEKKDISPILYAIKESSNGMKKIDDYISASQQSYNYMTEHIDMINKFDTKKSVIFENIDNMMGQLEPLLKEE